MPVPLDGAMDLVDEGLNADGMEMLWLEGGG